jgi:hypothetical protein
MKYSQWIGVAAALLLIGACYMPWAYFPDLDKVFTGFYSEGNIYGKPGKVVVFFSGLEIILFLIPKVWAKRANIFVAAMAIAFSVKSFLLYSACYRGICPERRVGIWLVLVASVATMIAAVLPDLPVKEDKVEG